MYNWINIEKNGQEIYFNSEIDAYRAASCKNYLDVLTQLESSNTKYSAIGRLVVVDDTKELIEKYKEDSKEYVRCVSECLSENKIKSKTNNCEPTKIKIKEGGIYICSSGAYGTSFHKIKIMEITKTSVFYEIMDNGNKVRCSIKEFYIDFPS